LTGDLSFPEGTVEWYDKIKVSFLEQHPQLALDETVLDTLFDDENTRAKLIKDYEHVIDQVVLDQEEYERLVEEIDRIDAWSYEARVRTVISQLRLKDHLDKTVRVLS
jgi:ATP-binding cassette subfamily F protein uup